MSERSGGFFRRGGRDESAESQGTRGSDAGDRDASGDPTAHGSDQDVDGLSTADSPGRNAEEAATPGDRTAGDSGRAAQDADAADAGSHSQSSGRSKGAAAEDDPIDGLAEFAAELKLLAESVLERVEPVLRQAADGQVEWSSCNWCPVCAAAALMRGQHHEVLQSVADHGTAIVTVLREALAGVPVEPVMPESDHARHQHNHGVPTDSTSTGAEPAAGHHTSRTSTRSRYVSIPVTIKA
ncbi:hypothetical protein [Nocardia suismassiliense]|uniref:hypothetical protein n=1 Tax=Nocardia suismassiliense TaxID=2077092 RepID=UPI001F2A9CC7|nr:hypothetical protein [Nocardia suismassiliense]